MKNIFKVLIAIIIMFLPVIMVEAAGSVTVSPGSIAVEPGSNKTIKITASNAAGRVDISSSDSSVATVSQSSAWVENGSISVTVKALKEGSATISVKITDVATFDGEVLSGTKNVSINVKEKKVIENTTDATLKTLAISGVSLDFKKDITNYSFEVNNDVNKLNIIAMPTISTAKVEIVGASELKLGKNTVKVMVTSKSGNKKEYVIEVTRKDNIPEATLETLSETLANTTKDTIAINIENNKILSNEIIKQIVDSKKNLIINKYDSNSNLLYSWNIENKNIITLANFDLNISFEAEDKKSLENAANFTEMLVLNLNNENIMDKPHRLKVFVGNKYTNGMKLNSYSYNKDDKTFKLIRNQLEVKDGFIEFEINDSKDLILTRANLINKKEKKNIFLVTTIVESVLLLGCGAYILIPKIKKK